MSEHNHDDCFSVGSGCSCESSSGTCSKCEEDPDKPLPDGWRRSRDDTGHIYYWHEVTRESRWSLRGVRLETIDFEASYAQTHVAGQPAGSARKRVVTNSGTYPAATRTYSFSYNPTGEVDTVLGEFSRTEEASREDNRSCSDSQGSAPRTPQYHRSPTKRPQTDLKQRLSSLVIQGLLPFHLGSNESKLLGEPPRISSNGEFKKLARKLTHTVQEKELSKARQRGIPLEITDRVRARVRDYVRAYVKQHLKPIQNADSLTNSLSPSSDV